MAVKEDPAGPVLLPLRQIDHDDVAPGHVGELRQDLPGLGRRSDEVEEKRRQGVLRGNDDCHLDLLGAVAADGLNPGIRPRLIREDLRVDLHGVGVHPLGDGLGEQLVARFRVADHPRVGTRPIDLDRDFACDSRRDVADDCRDDFALRHVASWVDDPRLDETGRSGTATRNPSKCKERLKPRKTLPCYNKSVNRSLPQIL